MSKLPNKTTRIVRSDPSLTPLAVAALLLAIVGAALPAVAGGHGARSIGLAALLLAICCGCAYIGRDAGRRQ